MMSSLCADHQPVEVVELERLVAQDPTLQQTECTKKNRIAVKIAHRKMNSWKTERVVKNYAKILNP